VWRRQCCAADDYTAAEHWRWRIAACIGHAEPNSGADDNATADARADFQSGLRAHH